MAASCLEEGKVTNPTDRYYGYTRASSIEQASSPGQQKTLIDEFIAKEGGMHMGIYQELESAVKVPWTERPQLQALLAVLQPGDHLVVWRLDRLERSMFRMISLLSELLDRGIHVHTLQETEGMQLDLNSLTGKVVVMVFSIAAEFYAVQLKEALARGVKAKRAAGLAVTPYPPPGKRRVVKTVNGKRMKFDEWDDEQVQLMYEIVHRVDKGESFRSVARDFHRRRLKKPNQNLRSGKERWWAPRNKSGVAFDRVRRAYYAAKEMMAEGVLPSIKSNKEDAR